MLSASLEDSVDIIRKKSLDHRRVYYLATSCSVPYKPGAKITENHDVQIFGTNAVCVGIGSIGTDPTCKSLLVSDSFGPCVPVVAIGRTGTHLAHFNGTGSINEFSSKWLKTHRIAIIQKARHVKQTAVSEEIAKELKNLGFQKVELAALPIDCTIGIVVVGSTA